MRRGLVALFALLTAACSEEIGEPGDIVLIQGPDDDAWSADPEPVVADVEKILEDGETIVLQSAPAPLDRFSLGRGGIGSYVVTGKDGSGVARARARSLPIDPGGFSESALPLFVSRTGRLSRAPGELVTDQGERPPVGVVGGRFVLAAGGQDGGDVATDAYDLGGWTPALSAPRVSCPTPPCAFSSIATAGASLVLAIGDSWAIWFDVDLLTSDDLALPSGLASWADVAGGQTVTAPDGRSFVVGATRADPPSQWVVEISPTGELFTRTLLAPRAGAAAAWVEGRGLVVVGGNPTADGVELLATDAGAFVGVAYPSDATTGAALVAIDASTVLRAGGRDASGAPATTVEIALGCGTACTPTARPEIVDLDRAVGFSLGDGEALVVGDDAAGETAAFRLGADGLEPVLLREPRRAASALALPTGHVGIVGGVHPDGSAARSIELFVH